MWSFHYYTSFHLTQLSLTSLQKHSSSILSCRICLSETCTYSSCRGREKNRIVRTQNSSKKNIASKCPTISPLAKDTFAPLENPFESRRALGPSRFPQVHNLASGDRRTRRSCTFLIKRHLPHRQETRIRRFDKIRRNLIEASRSLYVKPNCRNRKRNWPSTVLRDLREWLIQPSKATTCQNKLT